LRWRPNTFSCHPRESGDPVRRGLSINADASEYWITAFAGDDGGGDFAT